jgi:MIP family channel proteins
VERRHPSAYVAELLGTFTLVFFVCMVVTDTVALGTVDLAVIGLVHIFVLAMLIYTLGSTSGAHFNPAVTIALASLRKISREDAGIYIVMQLIGATLAAFVCKALLLDEGDKVNYGATTVSQSVLQGKAFPGLIAETIATFFLMWAIMGMAVNDRAPRNWAGLVIGATLGIAVMIFAPLTGASLNPARSFGPALASGEWSDFWIYVIGPIVGAILAVMAYTAVVLNTQGTLADAPIEKYGREPED